MWLLFDITAATIFAASVAIVFAVAHHDPSLVACASEATCMFLLSLRALGLSLPLLLLL